MVELSPADRVEVAEKTDDFRMPRPPQIAGQAPALVVQRLGRHLAYQERIRLRNDGRVDARHAKSFSAWITTMLHQRLGPRRAAARAKLTPHCKVVLSARRVGCWKSGGNNRPQMPLL